MLAYGRPSLFSSLCASPEQPGLYFLPYTMLKRWGFIDSFAFAPVHTSSSWHPQVGGNRHGNAKYLLSNNLSLGRIATGWNYLQCASAKKNASFIINKIVNVSLYFFITLKIWQTRKEMCLNYKSVSAIANLPFKKHSSIIFFKLYSFWKKKLQKQFLIING